jgi:hypothetical protein
MLCHSKESAEANNLVEVSLFRNRLTSTTQPQIVRYRSG